MFTSLRSFPIIASTLPLALAPLIPLLLSSAATMPKRFSSSTSPASQHGLPQQHSSSAPATFTDGLPLPKLFVFDLDYTLWPFWVDTHCTPPFKAVAPTRGETIVTKMKDRHGEEYGFYDEVSGILYEARKRGLNLSVASRTHAPDSAEAMLRGLTIAAPKGEQEGETKRKYESKPTKALDFFFAPQMYPGTKTQHFQKIQAETKRKWGAEKEVPFRDMIFFDDEARNRNVETDLGATFVLVKDGVTRAVIDQGVREWRRRRGLDEQPREANDRGGIFDADAAYGHDNIGQGNTPKTPRRMY